MSDYRDDREALHARNAALEDKLAEKEAEIAQLRANANKPPVAPPPPQPARITPSFTATPDIREDMFASDAKQPAWIGCAVLGVVYVAEMIAGRVLNTANGLGISSSNVWLTLIGTALLSLIVILLCGRPLSRLHGIGADFMVGRVYLPWLFGLFIPFHPLIEGLIRISSTKAGGYTTGGGDTVQRYQPVVVMKHGEGRPLGVALLMMALLWPLAVISLASPWIGR